MRNVLLVLRNLMVPFLMGVLFSDFIFSFLKQETCIFSASTFLPDGLKEK